MWGGGYLAVDEPADVVAVFYGGVMAVRRAAAVVVYGDDFSYRATHCRDEFC